MIVKKICFKLSIYYIWDFSLLKVYNDLVMINLIEWIINELGDYIKLIFFYLIKCMYI